jgi:hypothetical protein
LRRTELVPAASSRRAAGRIRQARFPAYNVGLCWQTSVSILVQPPRTAQNRELQRNAAKDLSKDTERILSIGTPN